MSDGSNSRNELPLLTQYVNNAQSKNESTTKEVPIYLPKISVPCIDIAKDLYTMNESATGEIIQEVELLPS